MPHPRVRHVSNIIKKFQNFWPVVGIVGPRQVGKTTLIREQIKFSTFKTLDDDDTRALAKQSAKVFLAQYDRPLVIDEITKAPDLFDGIKSIVDKKRIPNQFVITGSAQFSSKLGIRESLTGRIGIVTVNPLTIAEACAMPPCDDVTFDCKRDLSIQRHQLSEILHHARNGGMPVPMFVRSKLVADQYWTSWLDTTVHRDMARLFKRGFDPEFAFEILNKIAKVLLNGELASLTHLGFNNSRKVRTYLEAFESVYLLRRLRIHSDGVGTDSWMFIDSGLASHMMKWGESEGALLSGMRHFLWNETNTYTSLRGQRDDRSYYKSAKGQPVDWVWEGIPFKVVTSLKSIGWEEKSLIGAMNKLGSKNGYLIAPVQEIISPALDKGIGVLPWGLWS